MQSSGLTPKKWTRNLFVGPQEPVVLFGKIARGFTGEQREPPGCLTNVADFVAALLSDRVETLADLGVVHGNCTTGIAIVWWRDFGPC